MRFSLTPSYKFKSVTDITPDFLNSVGIDLLLLDLDNTLSPYKTTTPENHILQWIETMKNAGITLFMVSNNKGDRPEIFSRALGIPYVKRAKKPSVRGVVRAMATAGADESKTALVGDQIYTDMIAANLAGIRGILVQPIKFTNPFLAIRYFFELPFRHEKRRKAYVK